MKNLEDMTPDELRAFADKKENEAWERPVKKATLKHDLYHINGEIRLYDHLEWFSTLEEVNNFIQSYIKNDIDLKKGAVFTCFDDNGNDSWFDDEGFGVEGAGQEWADKHLENIKDV